MLSRKLQQVSDIKLVAWNEDTVNTYQFLMTDTNEFLYSVKTGTNKRNQSYHGTFSQLQSFDTIILKYDNDIRPAGVTNYLVREASGRYWIQTFESNSKRIFLRIQRWGHRF